MLLRLFTVTEGAVDLKRRFPDSVSVWVDSVAAVSRNTVGHILVACPRN
jgi:hypothetical protein